MNKGTKMHRLSGKVIKAPELTEFLRRAVDSLLEGKPSAGEEAQAEILDSLRDYLENEHDYTKPLQYRHRALGL